VTTSIIRGWLAERLARAAEGYMSCAHWEAQADSPCPARWMLADLVAAAWGAHGEGAHRVEMLRNSLAELARTTGTATATERAELRRRVQTEIAQLREMGGK